jgi:DNA polymerase-3 subunit beta
LSEGATVTISLEGDRLVVRSGRSRFTLSTLPAAEFPLVDEINAQQVLRLPQAEFKRLVDKVHFSMAQQDVRYYLNGMLLESEGGKLRAVATDGHRLALCEAGPAGARHRQAAGDPAAQGRAGAAAHAGRRGRIWR